MRQLSISYNDLKSIADDLKLTYYYIDFGSTYGLFVFDKGRELLFDAYIKKDGGADETDFNDNIKADATQETDTNKLIEKVELQVKPLLKVSIEEEIPDKRTGGHYQANSYEINVTAPSGWKEKDISFPYPISILSASWINKIENDGDEVEFFVGKDTVIGTITQDVSVSDTIINVSKTVLQNIDIGYYVNLYDGTNTDEVGRVISIDKGAKQITVETATINTFAASTPTYVRITVKIVPHLLFVGDNVPVIIGESKIGASHIPANTVLKARYNNISATAKTFSFILEYLY